MQAIIMCAGKGVRMHPLTLTRPKPLLSIANTQILACTLRQLEGLVDEAIIIVGYRKDQIKAAFKRYEGMKLIFVEQEEQLGTGHALRCAKEHITGDVLVLNGDDLYRHDDIKKLLVHDTAVLVTTHKEPERFGVFGFRKRGSKKIAASIVEKSKNPPSNLINLGCYKFTKEVFDYKTERSAHGEYEIPDIINALIKDGKEVVLEEAGFWISLGYPWDLLAGNAALLEGQETKIDGDVEQNVMIKGNVQIGKGTIVKAGTYIEGPVRIGKDCTIGPNAYLRPSTAIADSCKIGFEVEIKNSIIGERTCIPHLAYIGDSVVGEDVNVGAGSITANFRFDAGRIRSSVNGDLVDVGSNKFGTVIGDNAKLGVRTIIYPGRKIWPGKTTLPGEIVKEDIQ